MSSLLAIGRTAGQGAEPVRAPLPAPGPGAWRGGPAALPSDTAAGAPWSAPAVAPAPAVATPPPAQPPRYVVPRAGPVDWGALARLFVHAERVPLWARTEGGKVLLVYGTVGDAAASSGGGVWVGVTNTARDDGRVSPLLLAALVADVRTIAREDDALGATLSAVHTVPELGVARWEALRFAGMVRESANGTTTMMLRRADGSLAAIPAGRANYVLGEPFEDLWRAAAGAGAPGPGPAPAPAPAPGDASVAAATLSFPDFTHTPALSWLAAHRAPVLGYSAAGHAYFLALRDNATLRQVATTGWGGTRESGPAFSPDGFRFLDSAAQGRPTALTARHGRGAMTAQGACTVANISFTESVQVHLADAQGRAVQLSLADFRAAFDDHAVQALVTGLRTRPQLSRAQRDRQATYRPVPAGAPWFDASLGADAVDAEALQWSAGVALACQLARDPRYVQQMLRPSRDGNPHHVDVRFYSPAMDVDPHIVTLDDWLPLPGDAPAPAAVGVPLILKGLATFLDRKALGRR